MRAATFAHALNLSVNGTGPLTSVAGKSFAPKELLANLQADGYGVHYKEGKAGWWVLVTKPAESEYNQDAGHAIVARAFSGTQEDALQQAIYAAMKEEAQAELATRK